MKTHSDKALETIRQMATEPTDWQLTPIKWVDEERMIMGLVSCPTCRGNKYVRMQDGKPIPWVEGSAETSGDYLQIAWKEGRRAGFYYGNCPTCRYQKRGWGAYIARGQVKGPVKMTIKVGYPQFPEGVKFDSRYGSGCNCNLCNKLILQSGRVPVHAVGADGRIHGMFVGEDCGRKFLGVKLKREKDSIMEDGNRSI